VERTVEIWELIARESIRDLVARYNAAGDSGRFDEMVELFWDDATMEISGPDGPDVRRGRDGIRSIFTDVADRWKPDDISAGSDAVRQHYMRHRVATLVIDVEDEHTARGYSYFEVVMPHGLDHWGRYFDRFEARDGVWKFAHRRVRGDASRPRD
jgi:hypothetical protein